MDIFNLYRASLLAQMTYSDNLTVNLTGTVLSSRLLEELDDDGVTQAQAEYFAANYRVIYQEPTTENGFSATLFQDIATGEYSLAMRGTDGDGPDWADANLDNVLSGVSRNQVVDMLNFYLRLTQSGEVIQYKYEEIIRDSNAPAPEQPYEIVSSVPAGQGQINVTYGIISEADSVLGLNAISPNETLTIVGYSLGGHLASAFTLLFSAVSQETFTFNSAGFIGWEDNQFAQLLQTSISSPILIPLPESTQIDSVIDVSAPLDRVSDIWGQEHLGTEDNQVEVTVDAVDDTLLNIKANHSIDRLSDALAVINFLHTLDNSITIESANQLLAFTSNDANTSLEGVMNQIAKLFNQPEIPLSNTDHDGIYTTIKTITENTTENTYQIIQTNSLSNSAYLNNADGFAYRYALENLNPFAITGDVTLYTQHNQNGELNADNFSEQYLADRAEMLTVKNQLFAEDTTAEFNADIPVDTLFKDITSGLELRQTVGLSAFDIEREQYLFGSDESEQEYELMGGNKNDHIYGGGGNDLLRGMKGDDYLEGGSGSDTYIYTEGNDIILDSDGLGNINWKGQTLTAISL